MWAIHRPHHVPNITYDSIIDKLPQNIIRCKAYGIPNAQNKTCKMLRFLDQPDDDFHKSKHVTLMLYFKC